MKLTAGRLLVVTLALFAAGGIASAKPQHKESAARYYGEYLSAGLKRCALCHVVPEGVSDKAFTESDGEHNAFGKRLEEVGDQHAKDKQPTDIAARLKAIAAEDADRDGIANELELLSGTSPSDAGQKPAEDQLAAALVRQKAFLAEYRWAPWQKVERPTPPQSAISNQQSPVFSIRNPIDAFIAEQHAKHGLTPRPEAPKHVLLRRVYLDLIGLPPTAVELREFLADASPEAYEKVVDRLLADQRYGERWGRHWMDVWRYSDWTGWGAQVRDSKPHVWRWRDWIIDAQNADKPYDRQIAEMLAADELCPEDPDALRATGFLVRNFKLLSREQWMQDTVNYTTKSFLGITLDCARCHDHMYDALSQEEYYRFRAIFEPYNVRTDRVPGETNVEKDGLARVFDADPGVVTYFFTRGDERQADKQRPQQPGVPAALGGTTYVAQEVALPLLGRMTDKRQFVIDDDLKAAGEALEAAKKKLEATPEAERKLPELDVSLAEAKRAALAATVRAEQLEDSGVKSSDPTTWEKAAQEALAAQRQESLLEKRKAKLLAEDVSTKAEAAKSAATAKLSAEPENGNLKAEVDKTTKAATDAQQKLTAATEALTKSEQDVAAPLTTEYKKRPLPNHPEKSTGRRLALARWLGDTSNPLTARVAVNQIWMRHVGQPLVPTVFDFGNNGQVPTHPALLDWLAAELMQPSTSPAQPWSMKHLHRLIVTSSAYRLASTPDTNNARVDPDNRYLWRMPPRRMEAEVVRDCVLYVAGKLDTTRGGPDIDHEQGLKVNRRSLYFRHAPEKQMTFLRLFDAASPNECFRRKDSIIPQQALALANSSLAIEQARRIARQLHGQHADATAFVQAAYEQVLCRTVKEEEVKACTEFLAEQATLLEQNAARLTAAASTPEDVSKPSSDRTLRARENLVLVLLNHNDFVTIY